MKLLGVTFSRDQVETIVEPLGLAVIWKNPHELFLSPTGERWRILGRTSGPASRPYACVHGYSAAIERLLRAFPLASIETAVAVYDGLAAFEANRAETVAFAEKTYPDRCTCKTHGAEMDSTPSESLL